MMFRQLPMRFLNLIMCFAGALALFGCARSATPSFYLLTPAAPQTQQPQRGAGLEVAIFPVELPAYLDRLQIVERTGANEIRFSEFIKWAEPLGDSLRNLLIDNLGAQMPSAKVYAQPGRKTLPYNYGVEVRFRRFEGAPGNQAILQADWAIFGPGSGSPLLRQSSNLRAGTGGRDPADLVAGLSRLTYDLAGEIAASLSRLAGAKPPAPTQ